jgi:hypothetical protein
MMMLTTESTENTEKTLKVSVNSEGSVVTGEKL